VLAIEKKMHTYKKVPREKKSDSKEERVEGDLRKRNGMELMDLDAELNVKRVKTSEAVHDAGASNHMRAGLSEQLRRD
jgi:hypothetical protein